MNTHYKLYIFLFFPSFLILFSCEKSSDTYLPSVAISSPTANSTISGTITLQAVATDDTEVNKVSFYIRSSEGSGEGVFVNSAVVAPYMVQWDSTSAPSGVALEVYARAFDASGNHADSDAVAFRVSNTGVPIVQAFTAYTIPPQPELTSLVQQGRLLDALDIEVDKIAPPNCAPECPHLSWEHVGVVPQAIEGRNTIVEWEVLPFSGAAGFAFFANREDAAGPYEEIARVASVAGAGFQKVSRHVEASVGDVYWGAVKAVFAGNTSVSGFSNGEATRFLPVQEALDVADETVVGGKPVLRWLPNAGAQGYLYYLYDANPWATEKNVLWTNYPQSTDHTSAVYPNSEAALPSGTYYWWVAGVSFDNTGKLDAFSFSDVQTIEVP